MPVADIAGRAHLRGTERHGLLVPRPGLNSAGGFHVAASTVWNSLLTHLRSASIGGGQFGDGLKTHLFTQTYAQTSENVLV